MSDPRSPSQDPATPSPMPRPGPRPGNRPAGAGAPVPEPMEDANAQALSEALGSSFRIIKALMILLVIAFFASGIFTVNPNQLAVVLRFGKPAGEGGAQLLKPGLHWAFPAPIDEIVRIPVGLSHTIVSTAGWPALTPEQEKSGQLPPATGRLQPGVDGYALTGDRNIIHARVAMKYRITAENALDYEFNFTNPTNLLQNVLNNSLLYAAAHFPADAIIFRDKAAFRDLVNTRVKQLLEDLRPGITVDSLEVEAIAPVDVQAAFNQAYEAQLKAVTTISEAEVYAQGATNNALGQSNVLVTSALTRSNELVRTVAAEAASFEAQLPYYRKDPRLFVQRLQVATLQTVLTNAQEKFFIPNRTDGQPRELRLQLSREPQKPVAKEPGKPQ